MRAVVCNPSSTPEIVAAADGLGRAGMLGRYHVPIAYEERHERWIRSLPMDWAEVAARELRRRAVPPGIRPDCIRRTATITDVARVAVGRLPRMARGQKVAWNYRHAGRFDSVVSRALKGSDDAVLTVGGAPARRTMTRARELGIETWLDLPLPHHASIADTLRQEARRVPEYASTLQLISARDPSWLVSTIHSQALEANHLLVLSTYAARTFVDAGVPAEKMHVTPLGVDVELFQPASRVDDGVFRILFVGQLTQRKGISYVVDAFRDAEIDGSELVLAGAVIGDRPWARVPGVRHQPPLPRSELGTVYASADVCVLPSLADGFGLTALEAMACARPVIVSDHTFGCDIIKNGINGWTVPIRDVGAIVEHLHALASDPSLRDRMGRAARETAEQFTWRRYGDHIAALMGATG